MVESASTSGTSGTKTTITEEDYFNTPGQIAALAAYSKSFEAAHPGVTVQRQYVPFADLNAKLLTQAAGQDRLARLGSGKRDRRPVGRRQHDPLIG